MTSSLASEAEIVDRFGAEFGKRFFATLVTTGLTRGEESHLVEASIRLLQLAAIREPGRPKLRMAPGGLFIVNDDMPFLVDSVVGCLHGLGLETGLVVHPVMAVRAR